MSFLASADPEALLSPEAAAKLVLMRRKARIRFEDFMLYWIIATRSPIMWGWHISYLCDIMQAVSEREEDFRFLNINIPPRFLKSTILSQLWQSWMIGVQDSARSSLFSISSSATLAGRDSRRTLDTVRSVWYRALFPKVEIGAKETEAEWETKAGSYRIACGREGTVTGRGAHHLLVDDLVSAQEGDSEVIREQANEFLGKTLRSRLDDQRTGTITNIQQRLHERDATGVLTDLAKIPGGDVYRTISLPNEAEGRTIVTLKTKIYAVREDGDLLHPVYLGKRETLALKASQRRNYDGQYQQRPSKMEGGHIDPRRILRIQGSGIEIKSRLGLTPNFYLDFAGTEKKSQKDDPDFNVIHVAARDQLRRLIHLDVWRKQTADYGAMARILLKMAELWRPRFIKGEKGSMFNLFMPALRTQMILTGKFINLEPLAARTGDKIERSMSYQAEVNAGMVCAPQEAAWFLDYEAECRGFPNGAHDDMCLTSHTCIISSNGCKPISEITTSDHVLTRQGWMRVLWSGQTGVRPVMSVGPLRGTPNHRVWTVNRGWVQMQSLLDEDVLVYVERPLLSTVEPIIAIQMAPAPPLGDISILTTSGKQRLAHSTGMSGWLRVAASPLVGMFTIAKAWMTIACRRWSVFPRWRTGSGTDFGTPPQPTQSASHIGNITLQKGMLPSLRHEQQSEHQPKQDLQQSVKAGQTLASLRQLAPTAVPSIGTITVAELKKRAARNAESVSDIYVGTSPVPVFNLHVEGCHEFFAEGVLVHNCEGGFDAAMDNMQLGEIPTTDPTDPQAILSNEIKERLQRRIESEREGVASDADGW